MKKSVFIRCRQTDECTFRMNFEKVGRNTIAVSSLEVQLVYLAQPN